MNEKHFLQQYNIHKEEGALKATAKKEKKTGEKLSNDSNERIKAYTERLENIFLNPDEHKRNRNIHLLKPFIHKTFVIKDDNFPESYFEYQKKLMREERGLGDMEFNDEQKQSEIQKVQNNQKETLDAWIDYLTDNNPYSPEIKLFVIKGVLALGKFDTEKYKFSRRQVNDSTIAPFAEIDRDALAGVMGVLHHIHENGEYSNFSNELKEMAKNGSAFGKMYAQAIKELDQSAEGEKNWEVVDGEWRKFEQGSEPEVMQATLEGKRSNLCIGSG
ncbi:MAG: hypothetical protein ABFQ53_03905, partial [Patescibacteria group bacterium]